jgi:small-conductance mechanosensitive channel
MRTAVKVLVIAIAAIVLLGALGVSVAPLLTTLGIGGLAAAFGLRETFANLFAGVQITLSGNIHVGDFVKLETGEEGIIEDIHWRATRVQTLLNHLVVIPNSKLAESIVTNYHLPSKDVAIVVELGVHQASDLERVERVAAEVARSIMKTVPGAVPEFQPLVRFASFKESSIAVNVILRVREFRNHILIRHEFIKALLPAFAREGIVIPSPIRAINVAQERAAAKRGAHS